MQNPFYKTVTDGQVPTPPKILYNVNNQKLLWGSRGRLFTKRAPWSSKTKQVVDLGWEDAARCAVFV